MIVMNEAYAIIANRLYTEQYDCRTTFDEIYEIEGGDTITFLHAIGRTDGGEYWYIYKAVVSVYDEEDEHILTHRLDTKHLANMLNRMAADDCREANIVAEMHQQHYYY